MKRSAREAEEKTRALYNYVQKVKEKDVFLEI
jgi:hypothetical protein